MAAAAGPSPFASTPWHETIQDIPVLYCIHIEEMSGRRVSADPVEISLNIA